MSRAHAAGGDAEAETVETEEAAEGEEAEKPSGEAPTEASEEE